MTDEGEGKVAVEKGLPSLLRRTRSRQGRRRISPSFCCAVIAGVLVPASVAFPAPSPDPPPPGEFESPPTALAPDRQPRPPVDVPPSPPPAPAEPEPSTPVEQVVVPPVETPQPAAKRVTSPRAQSVGRQFAGSKNPARRTPPPPEARRNEVVTFFSSAAPDSRPYLLAAFSLAVFLVGTGTLLTVLTRLGSTRRGLA
jgi:hypothetical protein